MAELVYSERAADWLRDAEPDAQDQVMKKLEQAADFPDHFLKRLTNSEYYRVRAGDYRAILDWQRSDDDDEGGEDTLFVRRLGKRDRFYDS